MAETLTAAGLRSQLRDQLQARIGQTRDLLNAYQQAYPDLLGQTPGAVQSTLATQPVIGVNVHAEPQGLRPSYIAEQTIEPVEFGSFADPVSQLAFLAAPGLLRGVKAGLEVAGSPGPRFSGLAGERGNLGAVPRSAAGEALPESAVRTEQGQLKRLYHGTGRTYPDFEMSQAGSGAGGDLYGPGIYLTDNPEVASGYAQTALQGNDMAILDAQAAYWRQQQAEAQAVLKQLGPQSTSLRAAYEGNLRHAEQRLAELPQANVRPVYVDLKRPFDIEARFTPEEADRLIPRGIMEEHAAFPTEPWTGGRIYNYLQGRLGGKDAAAAYLQEQGYDGITHIGGQVTGGQPHRVYIAFSPDTVYPAANVEGLP